MVQSVTEDRYMDLGELIINKDDRRLDKPGEYHQPSPSDDLWEINKDLLMASIDVLDNL